MVVLFAVVDVVVDLVCKNIWVTYYVIRLREGNWSGNSSKATGKQIKKRSEERFDDSWNHSSRFRAVLAYCKCVFFLSSWKTWDETRVLELFSFQFVRYCLGFVFVWKLRERNSLNGFDPNLNICRFKKENTIETICASTQNTETRILGVVVAEILSRSLFAKNSSSTLFWSASRAVCLNNLHLE